MIGDLRLELVTFALLLAAFAPALPFGFFFCSACG